MADDVYDNLSILLLMCASYAADDFGRWAREEPKPYELVDLERLSFTRFNAGTI